MHLQDQRHCAAVSWPTGPNRPAAASTAPARLRVRRVRLHRSAGCRAATFHERERWPARGCGQPNRIRSITKSRRCAASSDPGREEVIGRPRL